MATIDTPIQTPIQTVPTSAPPIPRLETGDRLTRDEFERRYDAMPGLKKAELIEGVVYIPPPPSQRDHAGPAFDLAGWLGSYCAFTPSVEGGDNASLRLDLDNELQPNVFLRILRECGGTSRTSEDGYVEGAVELAAEVAASRVSLALHAKMQVYRRSGVREYLVWRVLDREVDWFVLRAGEYERLPRSDAGVYKSETFPGLQLDGPALLAGDLARVLKVQQEGLTMPEHAEFVQRLKQQRRAQ